MEKKIQDKLWYRSSDQSLIRPTKEPCGMHVKYGKCIACGDSLASLPALTDVIIDPEYAKTLKDGWVKVERVRYWIIHGERFSISNKEEYDSLPINQRRLVILAPVEKGEEKRDPFIQKHLDIIKGKMKDNFIHQHIGMMWGGLEMASIRHFVETGRINGSFRNRLLALIDDVMKWQLNLVEYKPSQQPGTVEEKDKDKEIERLEARIRELEEGWISVEARPPEINKNGDYSERVLVLTSSGLMRVGFMMHNEWFQDQGGKSFNEAGYLVTHYRPLPQPPKQ